MTSINNQLKTNLLVIVAFSAILTSINCFAFDTFESKSSNARVTFNKKEKQAAVRVQTQQFKVTGMLAWSEAKKNGFQFYPEEHHEGTKDGVDVWGNALKNRRRLNRTDVAPTDARLFNPAHIVGGVNFLLYPCGRSSGPVSCSSNFKVFSGKKLKAGWTIKTITFAGSYSWTSEKYKVGTNKISTTIKLSNPRSRTTAIKASLKEVILIGPKNGKWQDAFDV